jgi:predicted N-acetyltransferase YhbS
VADGLEKIGPDLELNRFIPWSGQNQDSGSRRNDFKSLLNHATARSTVGEKRKSSWATNVHVRAAIRNDIPEIVRISNSSIQEGEDVGFGGAESAFCDEGRLAGRWEEPNLVRGEEVHVAEREGRVVGVVTVADLGPALELINIDVPMELQGQGIGTALVRAVEDRARREGKRAVTLGTSRNAAGVAWKSLPWWQHLGYRVTHEEENAWTRSIGPGAREIRMRKELDDR